MIYSMKLYKYYLFIKQIRSGRDVVLSFMRYVFNCVYCEVLCTLYIA